MIHQPIAADYLATFLAPIAPLLRQPDVTDLYINGTGAAWVEHGSGVVERHALPALTETWLWQLSEQMARTAHQGISRAEPLLSATLPDGTRVQVVAPPATRSGFAIAFRRQVTSDFRLSDLAAARMFDDVVDAGHDADAELRALYRAGDYAGFLAAAVVRRKTIVVSGGTACGKTTFVNALLREIPADERLVTIEDSAELDVAHRNSVGLIAARGPLGESGVGPAELLQAALRLRPDRILLGEIRGSEALTFLHAINSGHPGSMTTVHADSPTRAIDQIAMLAAQSGAQIAGMALRDYADRLIDIVVQLDRTAQGRRVRSIRWLPATC